MLAQALSPTDRTERRLLILAGAFLALYSIILTLSDAARLHSWQVSYRWQHWLGWLTWMGLAWLAHTQLKRLLPNRDAYIFPIASLLTGWGLLTVWRLSEGLGLRQTAWVLVIGLISMLALRTNRSPEGDKILPNLRRFKYVWLTSGLLLTAATLILGTNPMGAGPRLWLGCCGFYFQPSEPLKLLLIVYLAAYLADRFLVSPAPTRLLALLTPTLIMTSLALLLLIFQRDLGTAAIFLLLYAAIVYAGTRDKRVLIFAFAALILASAAGYKLFDVVSQRVDAWINPWLDPSGRSYQIVQSLMAFANGGLLGRGPGLGSPGLVPIAQSDFIFSAISEEGGLLAVCAMLGLLALFINRGLRVAMHSADAFHRLLATGIVVHLVGQSLLIMAGNLRLLPLTGVTLPFVSYGGSSLTVSFFELLCLLLISNRQEQPESLTAEKLTAQAHTSLLYSGGLMLGLASVALIAGWWSVARAPALLARTDNPRRSVADRYVKRGSILDRHEQPLAESTGQPGSYVRTYSYPDLGPIVGYTHPLYGQAGLEASLDPSLRGLTGYPNRTVWWNDLLYGFPPPGLDVRLSIDLDLQAKADQLLSGDAGAVVLLNAKTGEILAMASSPSFDANQLDTSWQSLVNDPRSPLFDRAGMGLYPTGNVLTPFLMAASQQSAQTKINGADLQNCAASPTDPSLAELVKSGCKEPMAYLSGLFAGHEALSLLDALGLFTAPRLPVETLASNRPASIQDAASYLSGSTPPAGEDWLKVSPLQMALAAATLSNNGERPAPRLVMAYATPQAAWLTAPVEAEASRALPAGAARSTASALAAYSKPIWEVVDAGEVVSQAGGPSTSYAWYIAGTLPEWQGAPLAIAVLLEQDDAQRVQGIGRAILQSAMYP